MNDRTAELQEEDELPSDRNSAVLSLHHLILELREMCSRDTKTHIAVNIVALY